MPELHWLGDGEAKREALRTPHHLRASAEQVGEAEWSLAKHFGKAIAPE